MSEPPEGDRPPLQDLPEDGIPILTDAIEQQVDKAAGAAPSSEALERALVERLIITLRPWLNDRPDAHLVRELRAVVSAALKHPPPRQRDGNTD